MPGKNIRGLGLECGRPFENKKIKNEIEKRKTALKGGIGSLGKGSDKFDDKSKLGYKNSSTLK
jgi:hypothetical protein